MTRFALGTAVLLLALLDWTAGSTIAEPEGPNDGPPPDEMIPQDASLERTFTATAEIASLSFQIAPTSQGYVLEASNPLGEDRDVEVEVKVLETTVNPMARMAPLPREVASEKVALHCPAGRRVRHALQLAGIAPPARAPARRAVRSNAIANAAAGPWMGSFVTREFQIAAAHREAAQQRRAQRARGQAAQVTADVQGQTVLRLALGPRQLAAVQ